MCGYYEQLASVAANGTSYRVRGRQALDCVLIMQADSVEITVEVPASLADAHAAERARALLVLDAVRTEKMTWRAAAAALGLAPDEFLELARGHGVPVVRYESSDLHEDLVTLAKIEASRTTGA